MTVKTIKNSTAANFYKDFFLNGKTDCQSIVDLNFYTPPLPQISASSAVARSPLQRIRIFT